MSVFRVRNSPFFQYDFQIKRHRFYGSTGTANEREAKEIEKAKRAEAKRIVSAALASNRRPLTVEVAFDRWWDQFGRRGSDPDLKRALDWLKEQLGSKTHLHDVNDEMVSLAVEARRKHVKPAGRDANGTQLFKPISNRTVNKTVTSLLSRVFTRARKNWSAIILQEPEWSTHWLPETKRQVRELSAEEDTAIDQVESADYAEWREFCTIMGLRLKETLLTWPQVDFELGVIRLIGKGGKPATIPLTRRAYEILWGRRGHHKQFVFTFVAQRTRPDPWSGKKFVRGDRYPMTYHGIKSNKRWSFKRAGVSARIHDLRHTTGMRTLRATGNLKLVQALLRHEDIKTTAKFYTDATVEDLRAGMEKTARARPAGPSQTKSQTAQENTAKRLSGKDD